MTPERWHQITAIFHAARQRDLASRAAFLAEACRVDPTLRPDVEAMLAGHDEAGAFGQTPLDGRTHGFRRSKHGKVTQIDLPDATSTSVLAVNSRGDLVGGYRDASGQSHGFVATRSRGKDADGHEDDDR